nr:ribonuclease H-like domain-containing protein [Tanacetum cinerariifolium]
MSFEDIEAKFTQVWKRIEDFTPMGSKEEAKRAKRQRIILEKEQVKKQKLSEEAPESKSPTEEVSEDRIKEMMQLVPVEDVYVQALQVKHPIIDWKLVDERLLPPPKQMPSEVDKQSCTSLLLDHLARKGYTDERDDIINIVSLRKYSIRDTHFNPLKLMKSKRGAIDQTLFIRRQREDFILVQVYVDDIIFGSSNPQLCRAFEALMHEKFQMSAMGDILMKFRFSNVRSSNTPMDKENPWGKDGPGKDYLQNEHYALWEVIEFGDSYKAPPEETGKGPASESSAKKKGRTVVITTEDTQKRRNDVKVRTTLLLALPDEHKLRFSKYETAKELWEAILKTFGENEATKKTKKNRLKQQYGNFKAKDDLNQNFLTSLAPEWLMYTIVWRNRDDLDTMSLDDVYNHLKVYEPEVQKKSESNSQNMAFISSSNISSGKGEVHTASVLTANTQVSTASIDVAAASLSHDTICAYIATQSNGSQIKYEDITQIDEDDIEEMDIKWNMALLSMRDDRFWNKTSKKITIQGSEVAGFDKSKVECFNCHKMGHFARECRAPRSQDKGKRESYKQGPKEEEPAPKALMAIDDIGWDYSYMANEEENHALVADDEVPTEFALMAKSSSSSKNEKERERLDNKLTGFESASKDLDNLLGSQRSDKNKEGLGYNAVPPHPTQVYSPPKKDLSWTCLPEFVDDTVTDYNRPTPIVTDDFSRFTWTFFLRTNDETSNILRNVITEIENLKDLKVKIIRCDKQEEFKNKEMNEFCTKKGIRREFSNARTPQQNRVAERKNRILIEAARTMLADAKLPVTFWAEAVNTVCYVQNRVLVNKSQNKTPYELFNSRTLAIGFLRPFRCQVMILNTLDHLGKFDAKGDEGYLAGHSLSSKAFRVFNKRTKKVEENLHVDFLENKLIEKGAGPNWLFDIDTLTNSINYVPVVVAGTSSTNISGTKDVASQDMKKDVSSLRYIALPNWFHEAHMETRNSDAPDGCNTDDPKSMESKIPTVSSPVPTDYLDIPPESLSGQRLITKGDFSQKETPSLGNALTWSNRFEDTFGVESDFSNMETRIPEEPKKIFDALKDPSWVEAMQEELLQLKIQNVWVLVDCPKGMDVKSAFLYGTIDEEVYVMQPPGFQDPEFPDRVYKVEKAMYGLHQAPRAWYVLQKKDGIFLSQDKYVGDILKKFGYSDVRSANTPMDNENPWGKDRPGKNVELHLYRSMIGSLMYLTASRPDIMFAVCTCARHQVTPKECHLHDVKRIFRYLKGHPKLGLWYPKEFPFALMAYSDSDYGGATQDRKSNTGGCQFLGRRQYTRTAKRIAQSKALSPAADEPASLSRDDRQGEAFPTVSSLDAGQDRENIAKTSALPHESSPMVTSLDADKGSMQQRIHELMELCTSLQSLMEAANILTSGGTAASVSPIDVLPAAGVPTVSGSFPTVSAIFTTASVKVVEFEVPKKRKLQEHIDAQVAREIKEEFARENQRLSKQLVRDYEIAILHAEEELKMMIEGLDMSNEVIAKHLQEYKQAEADLSVGEKIELINELVKYQDHRTKILKYQA